MEQKRNKWLVRVSCLTYNHSSYITDTMNGFCMQQTNFPFVCTIVDDASTDSEQIVIRNYLEEHFDLEDKSIVRKEETNDYILTFAQHKTNKNCYFAVLFLKYNHYSIRRPKRLYVAEWVDKAKYHALCEGDDYWICSEKLQKQVEFLETHQDYTMVCNRTRLFSVRQERYIGESYCYKKSQLVKPKDVINRTGLFISTCSIVYRNTVNDNYPDYCTKCKVGDYPLQIMCAMKGKVYYFNDMMSVYRVQNSASWMGQQQWGRFDMGRIGVIQSRVEMLKGFQKDYPIYESVFNAKIADEINRNIPGNIIYKADVEKYISFFSDDIRHYSLRWKLDLWLRRCRVPKIRGIYQKLFLKRFSQHKLIY